MIRIMIIIMGIDTIGQQREQRGAELGSNWALCSKKSKVDYKIEKS